MTTNKTYNDDVWCLLLRLRLLLFFVYLFSSPLVYLPFGPQSIVHTKNFANAITVIVTSWHLHWPNLGLSLYSLITIIRLVLGISFGRFRNHILNPLLCLHFRSWSIFPLLCVGLEEFLVLLLQFLPHFFVHNQKDKTFFRFQQIYIYIYKGLCSIYVYMYDRNLGWGGFLDFYV